MNVVTKVASAAVLGLLGLLVVPLLTSSLSGNVYSSGDISSTIGAIFGVLALAALIPRGKRQ